MARKRLEIVFELEEAEVGCLLVEATQRNLWEVGCNVDAALRCTIRSIVYEAIAKALPRDETVNLEWAGMTDEQYGEMIRNHASLFICWERGVRNAGYKSLHARTIKGRSHWLEMARKAQARIDALRS